MKWVLLVFTILTSIASYAQSSCVAEGQWMAIRNPPPQCCQGLELVRAHPSTGSLGQCLKKVNGNFCIGEDIKFWSIGNDVPCCQGLYKHMTVYEPRQYVCNKTPDCAGENQTISQGPGSQSNCCSGLLPSIEGNTIKCIKETCVAENQWMGIGPGRATNCCQGLVLVPPPAGTYGSAGQCVKQQALNCVQEGLPLFQYPGAPSCCQGLSPGRPSPQSPVSFAQVCIRGNGAHVNNSEARKEFSVEADFGLTDDPGVSNQ